MCPIATLFTEVPHRLIWVWTWASTVSRCYFLFCRFCLIIIIIIIIIIYIKDWTSLIHSVSRVFLSY